MCPGQTLSSRGWGTLFETPLLLLWSLSISLKTVRKGLLEDGGILYLSPALQGAEHWGDLAAFTP